MAEALLTKISIPPNVLTAASTAAWIWDSSLTSTMHGRHFPPAASTKEIKMHETAMNYVSWKCNLHTLFGCCVDGAWQFWMWLSSFGSNHNISSISSCFQCNCFSNTPAGSSDENGAAGEFPFRRHHRLGDWPKMNFKCAIQTYPVLSIFEFRIRRMTNRKWRFTDYTRYRSWFTYVKLYNVSARFRLKKTTHNAIYYFKTNYYLYS